jgi:hypothetical protein
MRVFISWSKEPSRAVASALRDWLPDVIQSLDPWMSSADIAAGARWSGDIAKALAESKLGIICVTPQNQNESWLNFEAGALAKTLDGTFVCPYLIGMRTSDLKNGPLTQFQAKVADEAGTWELVRTINSAELTGSLSEDRLRRLFDRAWPDLQKRLAMLPLDQTVEHRAPEEILVEVLDTVRSIARDVNDSMHFNEFHRDEVLEAVRDVRGRRQADAAQLMFPLSGSAGTRQIDVDDSAADAEGDPPRAIPRAGVKVEHPSFGTGIVQATDTGPDPVVTARFPGHGPKRIKLRYLKLVGE